MLFKEVKDIYYIQSIIYYIDGGEMEREGRKGRDGTAEDAGVDYGLAGGNILRNVYGGGMERAWLGRRLSMKR